MSDNSSPGGPSDRDVQSTSDRERELREPVASCDPSPLAERRHCSSECLRKYADQLPIRRDMALRAFGFSVDGPYPASRARTTLVEWWRELEHFLRDVDEQRPGVPAAVPNYADFVNEVLRLEQYARAAADRFCPPTPTAGTNPDVGGTPADSAPAAADPPPAVPAPPPTVLQQGEGGKPPADANADQPQRDPNQPSANRQSDIIATIRGSGTPLQRSELLKAMKLRKPGKMPANLAWMVRNRKLISIEGQGYWPTDDPLPGAESR